MSKTLHLVSLGCPKNLVDSEVMLAALAADGYQVVADPAEAEVLLGNTCGFIQRAAEEAVDTILELATHKQEDPGKKLVVTGCLVQRYGRDLAAALPEVDLFIGLDEFPAIAGLLAEKESGQRCVISPGEALYLMDSSVPRYLATPFFRAYLKVTEGCDNRCSYCMIPSIRGRLRSRTLADLVQEAQRLDGSGVRELSLIAQDLSAYGQDLGMDDGLVALLRALAEHTSIAWIRLLYLYPSGISEALLAYMQEQDRILPYLDVPMQHVSDTVLRAMNRRYQRRQLEELVVRVRTILPHCALRTTFMVGFPGESAADVQELVGAIDSWRLDHVGVFAYQDEEGCIAARLSGKISEEEKEERRTTVMAAQAKVSAALLQERVGSIEPVLVEGYSRESELLLEGRTRFQAPEIDGCVYITAGQADVGDIVAVRVTEAHVYDLVGEVEERQDSVDR
ncbi:MAG: 30S ribosomal protein S12 methylthiotransferase RimO [Desulfobulbaceae bacterium]|nr:30S ribosomal protein S12 methylthiotransferase RimO [Desulfobulbaceae bacterium]